MARNHKISTGVRKWMRDESLVDDVRARTILGAAIIADALVDQADDKAAHAYTAIVRAIRELLSAIDARSPKTIIDQRIAELEGML